MKCCLKIGDRVWKKFNGRIYKGVVKSIDGGLFTIKEDRCGDMTCPWEGWKCDCCTTRSCQCGDGRQGKNFKKHGLKPKDLE